jgi:NADH:ubiquinone oxidoreductase subunit H
MAIYLNLITIYYWQAHVIYTITLSNTLINLPFVGVRYKWRTRSNRSPLEFSEGELDLISGFSVEYKAFFVYLKFYRNVNF